MLLFEMGGVLGCGLSSLFIGGLVKCKGFSNSQKKKKNQKKETFIASFSI